MEPQAETISAVEIASEAPRQTESAVPSDTIERYWDNRAASYSAEVVGEMKDGLLPAWTNILKSELEELGGPEGLHALDLGCGPGFFSMILARLGCKVDAMDLSLNMLAQASKNAKAEGLFEQISFHQGDISHTEFPSNSFDVITLRNVTWLMPDPIAAYREWKRLLVPCGKLLVFDANWYRYLANEEVREQREEDQIDPSILNRSADMTATPEQESACEKIAANLPLTYSTRPAWDLVTLRELGFSSVTADEEIWREVWPEGDCAYYRSSPLFKISAVK